MTDIHSHLIYGIDDGARSLEESIELIKKLSSIGFDNLIITPHYIEDSEYSASNEIKEEKLEIIRDELKKNNIDVNIFIGNEIFINENIVNLVEDGYIETLGDTNCLLIELPFHNKIIGLLDIISEIKSAGYLPIIAHPERYTYFQDDYSLVDELRRERVLFQCNYTSIIGRYGDSAEKLLKYMLKHRYVDYLGTDLHRVDRTTLIDNWKKIDKLFNKVAGKDYYEKIKRNCDFLVS